MRLLVADDDRVASALLLRALASFPFDVTVVSDGTAAFESLCAGAPVPTLAILDWMMPGLAGPDVCRRARKDVLSGSMYFILLTSLDRRADIVTGLGAGADDYVVKPFDPDELRARVQVGVRMLELQERLADQVADLQLALANVKQLQGLLPICSYCKRIRGDGEYWTQVEAYIAERSEAQFTHGICPTCYVTVEEQIDAYRSDRTQRQGSR